MDFYDFSSHHYLFFTHLSLPPSLSPGFSVADAVLLSQLPSFVVMLLFGFLLCCYCHCCERQIALLWPLSGDSALLSLLLALQSSSSSGVAILVPASPLVSRLTRSAFFF